MGSFHEGELEVQRRAGVALNAERIGRGIHATIPPLARQFALERPFLVVGAGDAAGRAFPHLFGGKLGEEEVESVKELKRPGGGWAGLEDEWLQ